MADVATAEPSETVVSKTVETTVTEDGTTVTTEETVVEVANGHTTTTTEATEVVTEVKAVSENEEKPAGENGQVADAKEEEPATEAENSGHVAPAVVVEAEVLTPMPEEKKEESIPKVILHQCPPGKNIPSTSTFCLKLETFLRLHKIPYENHYSYKVGKKGKLPWIEYKGERKCDSSMIIDFLAEKFEISNDKDFSVEQHAIGRAVQVMIEENTYWALSYNRYIDNFNEYKKSVAQTSGGGIGFSVSMKMNQRKVRQYLDGHGLGRHTKEEIYEIAQKDIAAVAELLKDKEYFLGDHPSSYDCTLFGFFANVLWCGVDSPLSAYIQENAKTIVEYCERMKELCWEDWNEMVLGEKAEPALKKGFSFRRTKKPKVAKTAKEPEKAAEDGDAEAQAPEAKTEEGQAESNQEESEEATKQSEAKPDEEKTKEEENQE